MSKLIKHEQNQKGRDFFVSDIHGEYDLLIKKMKEVGFDKTKDRMFSVGDLIDRGPESFECISLVFEPWFYGVRGNHELLMLDALKNGRRAWDLWFINGGTWFLSENTKEVEQIFMEALRYLPLAREIQFGDNSIGLVHAEPPQDWNDLDKTSEEHLVWSRTKISRQDASVVKNIDAVVVGHTILEDITRLGNVHYIDTGAFHTGKLTVIQAEDLLYAK